MSDCGCHDNIELGDRPLKRPEPGKPQMRCRNQPFGAFLLGQAMEHSHFEIHAEVYMRLKSQFPVVRGEYFYEPVDRRIDKYGLIKAHRFDVAVFNQQGKILAVVEIKKKKGKHHLEHYKKSVIAPVLLVDGMEAVSTIVQKVRQAINQYIPDKNQLEKSNTFMRGMSAFVMD